jgi:streptomycin 6-kinase
MIMELPEHFKQTIVDLYETRGEAWLHALPDIIADIQRRWSVRVLPHFVPLSYNFVAPVLCADGSGAVLKLGVPNRELNTECEALRLYGGQGMVQLYEANVELGAILMERVRPGVMLCEVEDDEQATAVLAGVLQQLWRPLPSDHPFPYTYEWGESLLRLRPTFNGSTGPYPEHLVDYALDSFAEMRSSTGQTYLLHGDMHHYNVLSAQRQPWLAIDPKGLAGDPAYDIAQLLLNPFDLVPAYHRSLIPRRIDQLSSELGIDRQRLIHMGITHTILSSWWSYEDHGEGWEGGVMVASSLWEML